MSKITALSINRVFWDGLPVFRNSEFFFQQLGQMKLVFADLSPLKRVFVLLGAFGDVLFVCLSIWNIVVCALLGCRLCSGRFL